MPVTPEEVDGLLSEAESPVTAAEVEGILEQGEVERDERVQGLLAFQPEDVDPQRRASILDLARKTRIPANIVEQRFPEFEASWKASQRDPRRWRRDNPELERMLLDNPEAAEVITRDEKVPWLVRRLRLGAIERERGEKMWKLAAEDWPALAAEAGPGVEERDVVAEVFEKRFGAAFAKRRAEAGAETREVQLLRDQQALQAQGLRGLERARVGWMAFKAGQDQQRYARLGFSLLSKTLASADTWADEKELVDIEARLLPRDYGSGEWEQALLVEPAQMAASQIEVLRGGGAGALVGVGIGALVSLATRGRERGVALRAGAKLGARFGARLGATGASFVLEAGSSFPEFRREKTDDGQNISAEEAAGAALLYGAAAAGIEGLSFGATEEGAKAALKGLMKQAGGRELLRRVAKAWVQKSASEGLEEFLQTAAQDVTGYLARTKSAGAIQTADPISTLEEGINAARVAATSAAMIGAAGPAVTLASASRRQRSAELAGQQVAQIAALSETPAAKAAPEALAEAVASATESAGERVESLHVDAQALVTLFQDANVDVDRGAVELLGDSGPAKVREAIASGERVEVPISVYMERWGTTEAGRAMLEHTTTRQDRETVAELRARRALPEQVAEDADRLVQEWEAAGAPSPASDAEARLVDAVGRQLAATGVYTPEEAGRATSLVRAFLRTQADRFGVSADELFREYTITVERALEPSPPSAVGAAVSSQELQVSPSVVVDPLLLEAEPAPVATEAVPFDIELPPEPGARGDVRAAFAALPSEAKERELVTDRITGLLNRRGFEALKEDPTRQVLAEWELEGGKWLNDTHGHAALDGALRTMAWALQSQGIKDGAKLGGSIRAWVRNPDQAGRIARRMQKALGNSLRVTVGSAVKGKTLDATLEAAGGRHADVKRREIRRGRLAQRGERPKTLSPEGEQKLVEQLRGPATVETPLPESLREAAGQVEDPFAAVHEDAVAGEPTGLLTADGWARVREVAPKAFVASADMRGLRAMNDAFGKPATDQILLSFSKVIATVGGREMDSAHPHGDEFFAQAATEGQLKDLFSDLEKAANRLVFHMERPDGSVILQVGVPFAYGIGQTEDQADRVALPEAKSQQGDVPAPRVLSREEADAELDRLEASGAYELRRLVQDPAQARTGGEAQAPGLTADPDLRPSAQSIADARAYVDSLRDPEKKAEAATWLEWALSENPADRPAPPIRAELELALGAVGVVDPVSGFRFDELGQSLERPLPGARRGAGEQPAALREFQERQRPSWDVGPFRYQNGDGGRGYVQRVRKGAEQLFRVVLQERADLSTFMHESAHIFMDILGDLAERPDAPEQVRNDWAAALEWMGAKDRASVTMDHAEKWAKAFEAYLMGGDPPSSKLRAAFLRFKRWMVRVYESIASVGGPIDDKIRGIFDRMLAVDQEVQRARRRMRILPLWRSAEDAGMTAEQWADYLREQEMATSHAERQAELRAAKEQLRRQEASWREEREKLVDAALEEFDQRPDARTRAYVYQGKMDQGRGVVVDVGRVSLNRESVEAMVGAEEAKRLFGSHLVAERGESPDAVADLFGYPTATAMIQALQNIPDRQAWAEEQADARMEAQNPDLTADVARLREVVEKGLQGDFTLKWLLREWRALRAKTGARGEPPIAAVQRAAATIASRRSVGILEPGRAIIAQGRAAEKATLAAARGDFAQAYTLQQQRLLNYFLFKELTQARDERAAFLGLAADLRKDKARARLGKASPSWRDAVDQILEAVELRQPIARTEAPASIDQAVADLERYAVTVGFDAAPLRELLANPKPWRQLAVSEMRNVDRALKVFKTGASKRNTAIVGTKSVEREIVQQHLIEEARAFLKEKRPPPSSPAARTWWRRFEDGVVGMDGALSSPEQMILWLGGESVESWWFQSIMKPLQDAKVKHSDLLKSTIKPIIDAMEKVPPKVRARFWERIDGRTIFPDHIQRPEAPTRRFELLVIALNAGNDSNLERLTEGRNISPEQVQRAINLLSKEEMDWVQSVWDAAESLAPEAFALEERDTGIRPPKIQARTVTTPWGPYRGGYFPAVYDRNADPVGELQAARTVGEMFDPSYARPGTSRSHMKSRADHYSGIISLDPSHIYIHLAQVSHDIAYREPLRSAANILLDPEIQAVMKERLGNERSMLWRKWLQDTGRMRGAQLDQSMRSFNEVARALRGNLAQAVLGWSTTVAMGDFGNLSVAATMVKPKHWAMGLAEYLRHPLQADAMVAQLSGEVRQRRDGLQREFRIQMRKLTARGPLQRGPLAWMIDHSFFFFEAMDRITSGPMWLGRYRQALAEGKSESVAIAEADVMLRKALPSGSAVDQSAIIRDPGYWGISVIFYGYMNKMYQRYRDIVQPILEAENVKGVAVALPRVTGRLMALSIAYNVIPELLMGRGPEEDEEWSDWFLRKLLLAPVASLPLPIAPAIESLVLGKRPSIRLAPAFAFFDELARAAYKAKDDPLAEQAFLGIAKAAGILFGVPLRPFTVQGKFAWEVLTGERDLEGFGDWLSGVVWGARERQPLNPVTAIQQAME